MQYINLIFPLVAFLALTLVFHYPDRFISLLGVFVAVYLIGIFWYGLRDMSS
jgi:hypothetical protein